MKNTLNIYSFLGLAITEERNFSAKITAAGQLCNINWQPGDIADADLVILTSDTALAPILLNRANQNGRPGLLFLKADESTYQNWPCVAADISVEDLADWLHARQSPEMPAASNGNLTFRTLTELSDYLCLQRQKTSDAYRLVSHDDACVLLLDMRSRIFYVQACAQPWDQSGKENGWLNLVTSFSHGGTIEPVDSATLTQPSAPQALERWLWLLGTLLPDALLQSIPPEAQYSLRRWPDFGALRTRSIYIRLTSALMKRPLTAAQISHHFPLKAADATVFLNACHLCGYLQWQQAGSGAQSPASGAANAAAESIARLRMAVGIKT